MANAKEFLRTAVEHARLLELFPQHGEELDLGGGLQQPIHGGGFVARARAHGSGG